MSSKKTLRQILDASDKCFLVPCVYDCASNHAVEMCGFPVSLLSGGEVSISRNGVIDYGFTNLTDLEEVISRVATTSAIPLIADIEDGFGGPLAVYRAAKRLAAAGAAAVQLEDSADMEESTKILPRDKYMAKVRAALEALDGTDCLLIARSNADPADPDDPANPIPGKAPSAKGGAAAVTGDAAMPVFVAIGAAMVLALCALAVVAVKRRASRR